MSPSNRKQTLVKNPPPVYVLDEGFRIQHVAVFVKNTMDVLVKSIPDDVPDAVEVFDRSSPPSIDDFSITVASYKAIGRWIAHLDEDFWYDSGAAVLLRLSPLKYVLIGDNAAGMTFEMQPKDEVVEFRIRLEGATPLVWVHGKNNTYLLSSRIFVSNKDIVANEAVDDPYVVCDSCETFPIKNVSFRF